MTRIVGLLVLALVACDRDDETHVVTPAPPMRVAIAAREAPTLPEPELVAKPEDTDADDADDEPPAHEAPGMVQTLEVAIDPNVQPSDVDNDTDDIPDVVDRCPDMPEDINGFEDNDGCPDPEPTTAT